MPSQKREQVNIHIKFNEKTTKPKQKQNSETGKQGRKRERERSFFSCIKVKSSEMAVEHCDIPSITTVCFSGPQLVQERIAQNSQMIHSHAQT